MVLYISPGAYESLKDRADHVRECVHSCQTDVTLVTIYYDVMVNA